MSRKKKVMALVEYTDDWNDPGDDDSSDKVYWRRHAVSVADEDVDFILDVHPSYNQFDPATDKWYNNSPPPKPDPAWLPWSFEVCCDSLMVSSQGYAADEETALREAMKACEGIEVERLGGGLDDLGEGAFMLRHETTGK